MFLHENLTRATNRHVASQPEDQIPTFRRTATGLVEIGGAILRYSSTTGVPQPEGKPKRKTGEARRSIAEIAAHVGKVSAGLSAKLAEA